MVKLNRGLVANGDVSAFRISADSRRVVYRADQDVDEVSELYSVPIAGGTTVKLNGILAAGGYVSSDFQLSGDSSRAVYRADQDTDAVNELYSVPIAGGTPTQLNGSLPVNGNVMDFEISADGARVAYRADQEIDEVRELYVVPITGGAELKLNGGLATGGDVSATYVVSPDGRRVVYRADQDTDGVYEVYGIPVAGGAGVKLNGPLVDGGDAASLKISPDGGRVVYVADQDTNEVQELYSVPITGGVTVKLNGSLAAGGDVWHEFLIGLDGARVVYYADQDADNVYELYSVPIAGGDVVKLNGALPAGGSVMDGYKLSPDGSRVVYFADQDTDGVQELYSVPVEGGDAVKLNGALVTGGHVFEFRFSADGLRVVYRADQDTDDVVELYAVPTVGGDAVKLNDTLVAGGDVDRGPQISPDGLRVVYRADQETDERDELYSVPITGGAVVKLNRPLALDGDVTSGFQISPDGSRVVYVADEDTSGVHELYSAPIAAAGASVKLNGALASGGDVWEDFLISSDGSRVVYRADQDAVGVDELYSVPITGGDPVKLNGPMGSFGDVIPGYRLSADGRRVFYRADQVANGVNELYGVPVGGGVAVRLNAALTRGGRVISFELSPDDSCVVYRADQDTDEVFELYVWKAQSVWASGGGDWRSALNWTDGTPPDGTTEAVVTRSAVVHVPAGASPVEAESLVLGGGSGPSVVELRDGAALTLRHGAVLFAGAVLRGDGAIDMGSSTLSVPAGAELRAGEGECLALHSGPVMNAGRIEAFGTSSRPAEMEFSGEVSNAAGTGAIAGHHATLRFWQGLANGGSLSFGNGINDVLGDVSNEPGGLITVSGGATAIFYDDVSNQSVINVSAAGGLQSTAVFFGALSGNGVSGGGHVFIEGDARPGFSAGVMAFGGDLSCGPLATLEVELGGTAPGTEYDRIAVAGHLTLGGRLSVAMLNGFTPVAGMAFDTWDAGSVSGEFAGTDVPPLPPGAFWHTGELDVTGELRVGLTPETYPEFAAYYGLTSGAHEDEEGDDRANLVEYIWASNPLLHDADGARVVLHVLDDEAHVTFPLACPLGRDVILDVETATTLAGPVAWQSLATRTGNGPWSGDATVTRADVAPGLERVTVVHPVADAPKRYYRLTARLLP